MVRLLSISEILLKFRKVSETLLEGEAALIYLYQNLIKYNWLWEEVGGAIDMNVTHTDSGTLILVDTS